MKTLMKPFALSLLLALLCVRPAVAQQYTLSNTTLNGAINGTQTTLVLTSASASSGSSFGAPAAGQCLLIDAELMRIVSIASTTATVQRARGVPTGSPHATLAVIWTGACSAFKAVDPPGLGNNQTCSTQPRPWINTSNGNVWFCNTSTGTWRGTNFATFTYGTTPIGQ
jgi:hypothetical protein